MSSGEIIGVAARFDRESDDLGGFREQIAQTAFDWSLTNESWDILALTEHDASRVLARRTTGNLDLRKIDRGLEVRIRPPDSSAGRDAIINAESGLFGGLSIAFKILDGGDTWGFTKDDEPLRTLTNVALFEISPVLWSAYPGTSISARSMAGNNIITTPRRVVPCEWTVG